MWLFKKQQLLIYRWQDAEYQLQTQSLYFPDFDLQSTLSEAIPKGIARCVEIAYERNSSAAIRNLKQQLGELPTDRSTGKDPKTCGALAYLIAAINAIAIFPYPRKTQQPQRLK